MEAIFGLHPSADPLPSHSPAQYPPSSAHPPSPPPQAQRASRPHSSAPPPPSPSPHSNPFPSAASRSAPRSYPIHARHVESAQLTAERPQDGTLSAPSVNNAQTTWRANDTGTNAPASESASASATPRLTHVDASGKATMVDVSHKPPTHRRALASALVLLGPLAFPLVASNQIAKGDVLTVAQIAGINGAKATSSLIPLCHNVPISKVGVTLTLDHEKQAVEVRAEACTVAGTGVEMEALSAAAVAALTVYDMCKGVSKGIEIRWVRLEEKSGGKSGEWRRGEEGGRVEEAGR
ncbi:hypothetical protein CLOM_g11413 [Closterium sp. NIES-68]|nr:hypothetical protein CLOM_g11413 [Closterium sp. NIES-68]GJP71718.1 hypothetical protein CLOP_g2520 [Closterium sp. NIES-67]